MARIFDDPNHRHYGPVRRLWVILVQLNLLEDAESYGGVVPWDEWLSCLMEMALSESYAQRIILSALLEKAE